MNTRELFLGIVLVTVSIALLAYREENHAVLGKLITMGILGLLAGISLVVKGITDEAHKQDDVPVQ